MIGLLDIQKIIADAFLNGDVTIAGIIMFSVVLAVLFMLFNRNVFIALILALPVTLIFSMMGVLSSDLTILLIIITVLGLAINSMSIFNGGRKG